MNTIHARYLFPFLALLLSMLAYSKPDWFTPFKSLIFPLLMLIMFGMGITLRFENFRTVFKKPQVLLFGLTLQYLVMPLAAFLISMALRLSPELLTGMMLVGCSAGGTASNVITYLARGNVALSISLTFASTMIAIIALPGLTWLYIGQSVPVPIVAMMNNILWLVIAPVSLGMLFNTLLHNRIAPYKHLFPILSMSAIVFVIAIIVATNQHQLQNVAWVIILAVIIHNAVGLVLGYSLPKIFRLDEATCRTLAIEVGMQNSGLSVALAFKHFSALAALPGALFSIWHNLSGALIAGYWSKRNNVTAT